MLYKIKINLKYFNEMITIICKVIYSDFSINFITKKEEG